MNPPRMFRHTFHCATCRDEDSSLVERRWTRDPPGPPARVGSCGHQLEYLCDVCGDRMTWMRAEDRTWKYVARWGVMLFLVATGTLYAGWRGLLAGLLAVVLFLIVATRADQQGRTPITVDLDEVIPDVPLKVLQGRAAHREDRRRQDFLLFLWGLAAAASALGMLRPAWHATWLVASAAAGAIMAWTRTSTLAVWVFLARDSRFALTEMRRGPAAAQSVILKRSLKVAVRRVLHRDPEAWEWPLINKAFEAAIETRAFVTSTDDDINMAMLKPVILGALVDPEPAAKDAP